MKRAFLFFALFALSCSTAQHLIAPGPAGSITGLVTTDGLPLPGVTVTVQSKGYPTRTAVTDVHGRYAFLGLTHGRYVVTTRLDGFTPQTYTVDVTAKEGVALANEMRVTSVSESITVTASAPADQQWLPERPYGRTRAAIARAIQHEV